MSEPNSFLSYEWTLGIKYQTQAMLTCTCRFGFKPRHRYQIKKRDTRKTLRNR